LQKFAACQDLPTLQFWSKSNYPFWSYCPFFIKMFSILILSSYISKTIRRTPRWVIRFTSKLQVKKKNWSKGRTARHIFRREPSNDYFIKILFLLSKWFQTKRRLQLLIFFTEVIKFYWHVVIIPRWAIQAPGSLWFHQILKMLILKRDTPRDHLCQVWLHLAKLFQRRNFF
jgi:hypothetical protein